jgi:hypothetical protein
MAVRAPASLPRDRAAARRPGGEREHAVEQRCARRAGDQARMPAGEAAEALAEVPGESQRDLQAAALIRTNSLLAYWDESV